MEKKRRIAIVGATASIPEHCARLWVADEPSHMILVGRDLQRIERVAPDLVVLSPESTVQVALGEFSNFFSSFFFISESLAEIVRSENMVDSCIVE